MIVSTVIVKKHTIRRRYAEIIEQRLGAGACAHLLGMAPDLGPHRVAGYADFGLARPSKRGSDRIGSFAGAVLQPTPEPPGPCQTGWTK